jgi:hypothetical protein
MLRLGLMLSVLWACLPGLARVEAQSARVSMSASSNRVAVGEPFVIEVRIESQGDDPDSVELPDFGELEVLGRSTSRPFSFSFGFGGGQRARVKSETVYGFTLRASERGAYAIRPAIVTVGGRRIASQALNILVLDPAQDTQNAVPPTREPQASNAPPEVRSGQAIDGAKLDGTMFVRTVVDKKRAYLGEQVTVTIYLYLRGQLGDSPSIAREPTLDGFWSHDLLPMQRSLSASRQEIQGRSYNAYILRRFAAFPLRAGTLSIGAPTVEVGAGGSIFDLLNGPGRPMRRDGVKVDVEVLPLPPQPTRGASVHTGTLTLDATIDAAAPKVGEAVTLQVVAKGAGNLRGLSLPAPRLAHVEVLAPEIDDDVRGEGDVIGGQRTFRWLLLPREPGAVSIPSFVVDAFDPASAQFTTVRSAPLALSVSGVAGAVDSTDKLGADADGESPAEASGLRFGPVRVHSELARRAPELRQRGWFWPSVLAAPLLLLTSWLLQRGRRELAARRAVGGADAVLREIDDKLAQAARATQGGDANAALSALAGALKKAVEARLGEPVGGLTLRALEAHLLTHALDPKLIARIVGQLGAIERARFDPGAQGAVELNQALEGVRAVTRELARVRAKRSA